MKFLLLLVCIMALVFMSQAKECDPDSCLKECQESNRGSGSCIPGPAPQFHQICICEKN